METANDGRLLQANAEKFPTYIERDKSGMSCLKLHHNNHKVLIPLYNYKKIEVTAGVEQVKHDESNDTISRSLYQILPDRSIFIQFSLKPRSDVDSPNHKGYLEFAMLLIPNTTTCFTAVEKQVRGVWKVEYNDPRVTRYSKDTINPFDEICQNLIVNKETNFTVYTLEVDMADLSTQCCFNCLSYIFYPLDSHPRWTATCLMENNNVIAHQPKKGSCNNAFVPDNDIESGAKKDTRSEFGDNDSDIGPDSDLNEQGEYSSDETIWEVINTDTRNPSSTLSGITYPKPISMDRC